ncbi:MAG TPA: TA system VapC family ribonuclease toxin [Bryobacteraceae bacterium]|jgi:toxin-antitoxin system PIN domain toxin|nr:TA system VapC family ribonuclease toxin [Bryobacteraceae bacterium]
MTSYLIDTNVWLAMTWDTHPQHAPASRWYTALTGARDETELLFCRFTMLGFLRLLTNEAIMGESTVSLREALNIYDRWRGDPRVVLAGEPHGVENLLRDAVSPFLSMPATKAVADCYLVAFAEASGSHLVTIDKAMAAAAKRRNNPVVLLRPA